MSAPVKPEPASPAVGATAGPWREDPMDRGIIRDSSGPTLGSSRQIAAIVAPRSPEGSANARLIAAAPEMRAELERCQDLLFGLLDYFDPGHELTEINRQRERNAAVLSKVRA